MSPHIHESRPGNARAGSLGHRPTPERQTTPVAKVSRVLQSPGQPLDQATRATLEPRFGHDFSRVRIHSDEGAAAAAEAVRSRALTVGRHIVFSRGAWKPETDHGMRLLAHELTHVVQQNAVGDVEAMSVSGVTEQGEQHARDVEHGAHPASKIVSESTLTEATIQRAPGRDGDDPLDRRRQSRPRNAPSGTRPIDQTDLDRETIHKIKDGIGAGPKDWVGITPDGEIITTDSEGNAEPQGHVTDYTRNGSEYIPRWVWGTLAFAAMIALIVLFATGVGEAGLILAGAGAAVVFVVNRALRAAGREPATVAGAETAATSNESSQV